MKRAVFNPGHHVFLKYAILPLCLFFLIISLLRALAPPLGDDALAYHLALPKIYLEAGGFQAVPWMVYSHFPLSAEMIYTLALAFGSPVAAALVHFLFGLFAVLTIAALGEGISEKAPGVGIAAAAIFLSTPLIQWEMGTAYNDLVPCFFLFLSFSLIVAGDRKSIVLAGLSAGFAVAAKLTAGPYVFILLACLLARRGGGAGDRVRTGVLFLAASALPVLPWLVKTFLETGNPVFPFMYETLGGKDWNIQLNREFVKWHFQDYGMGKSLGALLSLPWNLTFKVAGNFGWKSAYPERELGCFFLFFLPLLFVSGKIFRKHGAAVFMVVAGLAAWFAGSQQIRFLLNFWPCLCLLYAAGLFKVARVHWTGAVLACALAAGAAAFTFQGYAGRAFEPAGAAFTSSEGKKISYIEKNLPPFRAFAALDLLTADDPARAGIMMESRTFYSSSDFVWLTPTQQGLLDYSQIFSGDSLYKRLGELDIGYVMIHHRTYSRLYAYLENEKKSGRPHSEYFLKCFSGFRELLTGKKSKLVYADNDFAIFKLN